MPSKEDKVEDRKGQKKIKRRTKERLRSREVSVSSSVQNVLDKMMMSSAYIASYRIIDYTMMMKCFDFAAYQHVST